jgi:hypothetical protein
MPKPVGWVLLGGKKWYPVYTEPQDKFGLSLLYFLKDGCRVLVTKYHPFYSNKMKAEKTGEKPKTHLKSVHMLEKE